MTQEEFKQKKQEWFESDTTLSMLEYLGITFKEYVELSSPPSFNK